MPQRAPESIVNYSALRAAKGRLGVYSKDLVERTGMSWPTVTNFFNGAETLNLKTIKKLAAELRLRVRVEFDPIDQDTDQV
jgi:hypothetical protein